MILLSSVLVAPVSPVQAQSGVGEASPRSNGVSLQRQNVGTRVTCDTAAEVFKLLCDAYREITESYLGSVESASLATKAAQGIRDAGLAAITGTPPPCPLPSPDFEQVCVEIDKVEDPDAAVWAATKEMVASVDPYSRLLTPAEHQESTDSGENKQSRLGIELGLLEGDVPCTVPSATCQPVIVEVHPGSSAESAGLMMGDVLEELNGTATSALICLDLSALDRFDDGTIVTVKIRRGSNSITRAVAAATITVPIARGWVVDRTIGYLRLDNFGLAASDGVARELQELLDANITGLAFDLRDNPGGDVRTVIKVASLFLPGGSVVAHLYQGSGPDAFTTSAMAMASDPDSLPMVVMVNERTASGSELLIGALSDHDRAKVVGGTTYGKDSGQRTIELQDNNGDVVAVLILTTLRWTTPLGRSAQGGLFPRRGDGVAQVPASRRGGSAGAHRRRDKDHQRPAGD